MELQDYLMQFLLENSSIKDEEFDGIYWSLINAIKEKHYVLFNDDKNNFTGFLTWEIRESGEVYGKIDLGITNLVIAKKYKGKYPIHRATTFLRQQYPNIHKFIWQDRKKKQLFEFIQKDKSCLSIS